MAFLSLLLGLSPLIAAIAMVAIYIGFALFQTAMVNAISQTLPAREMGVGMGLFNLMGILSGAVGTALVGKILDSGLLDFPLLTLTRRGFAYSNLLMLFTIISLLAAALYFRARPAKGQVPEAVVDSNCLEPAGC
jgi:DHA2 family metal-tetracycline-proton antiporter-like MFS transporter